MGSTPSYQVQPDVISPKEPRTRRPSQHQKESVRSTKNKHADKHTEINPEQNEVKIDQSEHSQSHTPKDALLKKESNHKENGVHHPTQQEIMYENHYKWGVKNKELQKKTYLDSQNAYQKEPIPEKELHHRESNKPKIISSPQIKQQETETHETPTKGRHYYKASTHQPVEETIHSNNITKKQHRRSQDIDYKEYDSMHIRHKAIQEVVQRQHHVHHPITAREAVYQHQKLYPKVLKNLHHEPIKQSQTNRHYQHEHNLQEQAYQQPHHLHLHKRNIIKYHPQEHEQHPLQKSMEVRAHPNLTQEYEVPLSKANFKKRKASLAVPNNKEQIRQEHRKQQQIEEKSIIDINKQKQFNVTEYPANPTELVTCREGCGRKFQSDRIEKHEAICKKVFQKQRGAFNTQNQRITSKQQQKLLKKREQANESHHRHGQIPKWKAQSIALRAHIKMGKNSNYKPNDEQVQMLSEEHYIDVVTCPICDRKFNKNAAKTHIPFCQAQHQKQLEKERFEKHKSKR